MSACFRVDDSKQLVLDVSVSNNSGQTVTDFDLMFNKNPFGIAIYNAVGALKFPSQGQTATATLKCSIDKKNLDPKNPPKSPFMV
jgi:AP-1 complex subunit beta-1